VELQYGLLNLSKNSLNGLGERQYGSLKLSENLRNGLGERSRIPTP
jgi:hypothetical protein